MIYYNSCVPDKTQGELATQSAEIGRVSFGTQEPDPGNAGVGSEIKGIASTRLIP